MEKVKKSEKDKKKLPNETDKILRKSNDAKELARKHNSLSKTSESSTKDLNKNISKASSSGTTLQDVKIKQKATKPEPQSSSKSTIKSGTKTSTKDVTARTKADKEIFQAKMHDKSNKIYITSTSSTSDIKYKQDTNKKGINSKETSKSSTRSTNATKSHTNISVKSSSSSKINNHRSDDRNSRSITKRKDKVLETHTNVTVQSPVHSKKNSFVVESKPTENAYEDKSQNVPYNSESKQKTHNKDVVPSTHKPVRTRTNTQILDTSEIKILKNISYTIDLENPDADISLTNYPNDENYEYEDDFESYESDFESCSSSENEEINQETTQSLSRRASSESASNDDSKNLSTKDTIITKEEERKLDSGNFDLRTKQSYTSPSFLADINETENVLDEGFVEQINQNLTKSNHFLDFTQVKNTVNKKVSKRGKEILSKLKLDEMTFHLFEMQPLTYNEYMCIYGNQNSVQSSTQTKDDNLCVDTQTDEIISVNKWTQHPIEYSKYQNESNKITYKTLCTGSDDTDKDTDEQDNPEVNFYKLNEFLKQAGKEMLVHLEEQLEPKLKHNKESLAFSDGHYRMHQNFKDFNVVYLSLESNKNLLAAAFRRSKDSIDMNFSYDMNIRHPVSESYIAIWHIQDASSPKYILKSNAIVNCCCFIDDNIIVAGCTDGSVLCWDLIESTIKSNDSINSNVRLPSQIIMDENTEHGLVSQITLMNSTEYDLGTQVCVLHHHGYISILTLVKNQLHNNRISFTKDPALSLASNVRLIQSHILKIKAMKLNHYDQMFENNLKPLSTSSPNERNLNKSDLNLEYEQLCLDSIDAKLVYVFAKYSNYIVACSISWTDKFQYYIINEDSPLSISSNPYKQPWFTVLCTENIYIFKKLNTKPIIKILLSSYTNMFPNFIRCSPSCPETLFAIKGSYIWVIDIMKQEVLCHGNTKETIYGIETFRRAGKDYMVISYKNRIEVHKLSKKYRSHSSNEIRKREEELSTFIHVF